MTNINLFMTPCIFNFFGAVDKILAGGMGH